MNDKRLMNCGGYGPNCPDCGTSAEWTEFEIQEPVFAPKTYQCPTCYKLYTLSVEEVQYIQIAAQNMMAEYTPTKETERDWQQARYDWDNPKD